MPRPLKRVLVTAGTLHPAAVARLMAAGLEVEFMAGAVDETALLRAAGMGPLHAIVLRGNPPVTRRLIAAAPDLVIIAKHGAGVDSVDLAAAGAAGIIVATAGDTGAAAVAELTLAMMLALRRNLLPFTERIRAGHWDRGGFLGQELGGQTLGIVGLGRIGTRVAGMARMLGMNVLALRRDDRSFRDVEAVSLDMLLARADIVTLHCPLTEATRRIIDAAAIARMRRGAMLINTARGPLVDEAAIAAALRSGHLAGAAFDVFGREPLGDDDPLRTAPNVVLTPHIGSQTAAALQRTAMQVADNVLAALSGQTIPAELIAASASSQNEVIQ